MGPHQTRAHIQQFWLWTVFAALSLRHFKAAPSLRDMLHWLYRGAHSVRAFSLSLGKVGQSHSAQSGVLKINEDIAQVNQLTKHA